MPLGVEQNLTVPIGKKPSDMSNVVKDENAVFLQAEPISRKRMDLLWLDPPRLAHLQQQIVQHKVVEATMGDSSNLRTHEFTQEDVEWAKRIEVIVDKAFALGQRGKYSESIQQYKLALEVAPGCDLFLMSIGVGYANLRQKANAVRYLERAAQISPGNMRIRENLDGVVTGKL
jgi:tetratricopeptide (TPR) repeat protein